MTVITVAGLLLVGGLIGERVAGRRIYRWTKRFERNEFIGQVLTAAEREGVSACYDDPARALAELDVISWTPPAVPAPFVGHAAAPGRSGNARIGPHHFRDDRSLDGKPRGTIRIFITGGSTAYGSGAPDQERTIAGLLEMALRERSGGREFEVVTAAYPGWTSTHELLWTTLHVLDYQPDLVVALSGNNDVHWGMLGNDVRWHRLYPDDYYFNLLNEARAIARLPGFAEIAPGPREVSSDVAPVPAALVATRHLRNARLTAAALEAEGARYLLALQPTLACTGKALTRREREHRDDERLGLGVNAYFQACYEELRTAARSGTRVSFVDLSAVFDDTPAEQEVFVDSYHFGDRGNARIARALVEPVLEALEGRR